MTRARGVRSCLGLVVGLLGAVPVAAQHLHVGDSGLPKGVPDYCQESGSVITASGQTTTWSGTMAAPCFGIHGTVNVANGTTITTKMILVYDDGVLNIGSAGNPAIDVEIIIADQPLDLDGALTGVADPEQLGGGIICFGKCWFHGQPVTPRARFTATVAAGASSFVIDRTPMNWAPGDILHLTHPAEDVQIASVNGATIDLVAPTVHAHAAFTTDAVTYPNGGSVGAVTEYAYLAHITRSIVIRSQNPSGVRGHTMASQRADVDIRYVQTKDMGRTDALDPLNSTTFSGDTVTHVGTNQIGRYSFFHAHHLMGPAPGSGRPYQYVFVGNVCMDDSKWCFVAHNAHYGLFEGNVCVRSVGSCFTEENGSETANKWIDNLASELANSTCLPVGNYDPEARCASGFWMRGINHVMTGNVVANARTGIGWWTTCLEVNLPDQCAGELTVTIPKQPGADTKDPGNLVQDCLNAGGEPTPCTVTHRVGMTVSDNMVYDSEVGLDHWWTMRTHFVSPPIRNTRIWNTEGPISQQYSDIEYDGLFIAGATDAIRQFNDSHAVGFGPNPTIFRHVDARDLARYAWLRTGQLWQAPLVELRDSKFESPGGIRSDTGGQKVDSVLGAHSYLTVDNVRFAHPSGGLLRTFSLFEPTYDIIPEHEVHITVTNYQGEFGKNFTLDLQFPLYTCSAPADVQPQIEGYVCTDPGNRAPIFMNPGSQTSHVGQATSLQLTGSDPEGGPLSYSISGLPAGLTLLAATGRISGTPTTPGSYLVTARVSDGVRTSQQSFAWIITSSTESRAPAAPRNLRIVAP